jgi:tetratricopeptide (TPR) repeat protein
MRTTARHLAKHALVVLIPLLVAPMLFAMSPRITFMRLVPAAHPLGNAVDEIAIVQAIGDHSSIEQFVGDFMAEVNRAGFMHVRDMRQANGPSDVYLSIKTYRCDPVERSGEGGTRDVDGNRVRRKQAWIDVTCSARIDVLSNVMKYQSTFYAKGEGTSPRAETLGEAEREIAYQQAARYAALDAAERITPRRVRESIPLDENAPAFEEAFAMISGERLAEARRIWEKALGAQPRSAPLRFNLAAVCEAMGDRRAAALHYTAARDFAPAEPRYASELKLFLKRDLR